jgi:SAM-dependent methyltransferase
MVEDERVLPIWEQLYQNRQVESMPWYYENLDEDLDAALNKRNILKGNFLDLGTGPGTQAIRLFERGFTVTGSDLSGSAIRQASRNFSKGNSRINFVVDDILNSRFREREFDFIFDRGCFHVIPSNSRVKYIREVNRILKDDGLLFIKCFSDKEPMHETGPYRFSGNMIKSLFVDNGFEIKEMKETVYQGTLNPLPKALFVVMAKIKGY